MSFVTDVALATNVLDALLTSLDGEPTNPYSSPVYEHPPTGLPPRPLDMIVAVLRNNDNKYSPELRINVCSLVTSVGRLLPGSSEESRLERDRLRDGTYAALKGILDETLSGSANEVALKDAARRTLSVF